MPYVLQKSANVSLFCMSAISLKNPLFDGFFDGLPPARHRASLFSFFRNQIKNAFLNKPAKYFGALHLKPFVNSFLPTRLNVECKIAAPTRAKYKPTKKEV